MRRYVLLVGLLLALSACAHPRHTAVVADTALYEVLNDTHTLEQQVLCGVPSCAGVSARVTPGWTDSKSQAFNRKLLPSVTAGQQFNTLLSQWDPTKPMPQGIHDIITSLTESVAAVVADFPTTDARKAQLLQNLARAQSIALTALNVVLSVAGR